MGESGEKHLKREVGFLGLLAACVGLNIGGALFALTTVAAGICGPCLPLAMLVSALPMLLVVFPYVTLTSALPTTSGSYRYAQLFDPGLALVSMLTLLLCILLGGQPLFAFAFGKYLAMLTSIDPITAGAAVLVLFYAVNLVGVRTAAWVQTALSFFLLSALVLFIVAGIPWIRADHFSDFVPKGVGSLLAAFFLREEKQTSRGLFPPTPCFFLGWDKGGSHEIVRSVCGQSRVDHRSLLGHRRGLGQSPCCGRRHARPVLERARRTGASA